MKNIYEIMKSFGLEVPEDKKADFDKAVLENYKTWIFLKRRKLMKNVLLWIWQLPQNLLGLVV